MKRHDFARAAVLAAALSVASSAVASDFGAALSLSPKLTEEGFSLTVLATPWFSSLLGQTGSLYLSGVAKLETTFDSATVLLDLGRSQMTLRPSPGKSWEFGRLSYADESGFVASGLFDGARWTGSLGPLGTAAGLFYTGLLNKKSAEIVMTAADSGEFLDPDRFFAPSRIVASFAAGPRNAPWGLARMTAQAVVQLDLRGGSDTLHSQYLTLAAGGPLGAALSFDATLTAALAEPSGSDVQFNAAASGEMAWNPPGGPRDQAYLGLRAATGSGTGFPGITTVDQGSVFTPGPSGLGTARIGYRTRPSSVLAADVQAVGFLRFAEGGPEDADLDPASDSAWLGAELYTSLTWTPASDVSVLAGAGVFLPAAGGAFLPDTPARWLVSVAAVLSL